VGCLHLGENIVVCKPTGPWQEATDYTMRLEIPGQARKRVRFRWPDFVYQVHRFTCRPGTLLWTSCCYKRRRAGNLRIKPQTVYPDIIECKPGTGCQKSMRETA
jgi:hypothetical protein